MVGIRSFPFGAQPIFRCELLVLGSVNTHVMDVGICDLLATRHRLEILVGHKSGSFGFAIPEFLGAKFFESTSLRNKRNPGSNILRNVGLEALNIEKSWEMFAVFFVVMGSSKGTESSWKTTCLC